MKENNYSPIRLRAKEARIRNWHNKNLDTLKVELGEVAIGQYAEELERTLDKLEQYAKHKMEPAMKALDILSDRYFAPLVKTFDYMVWVERPGLNEHIALYWIVKRIKFSCGNRFSEETIKKFLKAVCDLYSSYGWEIRDEPKVMVMSRKPSFNVEWHVDLWDRRGSDRPLVYRMLAAQGSGEK